MKASLAVLVILVTLTGAVFGALEYFARASDVAEWEDRLEIQYEQVAQRLERKILQDDIRAISQRLWQLEDRNHGLEPTCAEGESMCLEWPPGDLDEYRRLLNEKIMLERELER